jgi:nicotinamidase-related amidase
MTAALLVIDMQMEMAFRTRSGRERANPQAEENVAALLALFRAQNRPVIHVHHDEPGTPVAFGAPGGAVMPCAMPRDKETILTKNRSSAFHGTGLDAHLKANAISHLVIAGAVAAFCVTSTTRAASDLGYTVLLPHDALIGFDIPRSDGSRIAAATVLDVTLALLGSDFARSLPTADIAAALPDR